MELALSSCYHQSTNIFCHHPSGIPHYLADTPLSLQEPTTSAKNYLSNLDQEKY